jgi:hypothetical protein
LTIYSPNLESLPNTFGDLRSLKKLKPETDRLKGFPESVRQLSSLQELEFSWARQGHRPDGLAHFPSSLLTLPAGWEGGIMPDDLGLLCSLTILKVNGFKEQKLLPEDLGQLSSLHTLEIRECSLLERLPESLGSMPLQTLTIEHCAMLKRLPESSGSTPLKTLDIRYCENLEKIPESWGLMASEGVRVHITRPLNRGLDDEELKSLHSGMLDSGWLRESIRVTGSELITTFRRERDSVRSL